MYNVYNISIWETVIEVYACDCFSTSTSMIEVVTPVTRLPGRAHLRSAQSGDYNIPRALVRPALVLWVTMYVL